MDAANAASSPGRARFGTFGGVFTPCTLTILGVIMFLRLGQVVGRAGVLQAVAIILLANAITLLTGLSLSAIATNTRVKGGGAYYLISRSLGVEFGGAIGIVFFLAQAIAVSMYVVGFTEACVAAFPAWAASPRVVATVVNVCVFVCVFIGAGWTVKLQYAILAVMGAALASFFVGALAIASPEALRANVQPAYAEGGGFFATFALFFPAVTGIMAGANMSGDLKNPGRMIPLGTLAAIGVTALVYLAMTWVLGASCSREMLLDNNYVVRDTAWWPMVITAGIFAATLSSALSSLMGAPRILQALAKDDVFRWLRVFGRGSGRHGEPRRAIVLTFAISQACVLAGDLDTIAPLITMAFLITYGTLNLATYFESITKNPSYRPRFRYSHWSTALLGGIGCLVVMFLIAPVWAIVSFVVMAVIYRYVSVREIEARWGDVRSGAVFERARRSLLALEEEAYHPKNWRPIVLALSGAGWQRTHLAVFGHWLTAGHGVLTLGQVIQGDVEDLTERRHRQEELVRSFIQEEQLQAFPAVVVAPYLSDGIESLVQCHGLGVLRPNTLLLGWPSDPARVEPFGAILRVVAGLRRNIVAVRSSPEPEDPWEVPQGTVDVWWRGKANGPLMLLLAHLLTTDDQWRTRTVRLLRVVPSEAAREETTEHLRHLIETSRIRAVPGVIVAEDVVGAIQQTSRRAAVVVLGFEAPEEGAEEAFFHAMETLVGGLPRVIFVDSAGGIELET
ncbi:MAG: amino acid permease [Pirellulales bacterium]|nr:amino acid permease [Pirellulales bacterium]